MQSAVFQTRLPEPAIQVVPSVEGRARYAQHLQCTFDRRMGPFDEAYDLHFLRCGASCFFEKTVLKHRLGERFLQITRLTAQTLYFAGVGLTFCIPSQALLASFHELL